MRFELRRHWADRPYALRCRRSRCGRRRSARHPDYRCVGCWRNSLRKKPVSPKAPPTLHPRPAAIPMLRRRRRSAAPLRPRGGRDAGGATLSVRRRCRRGRLRRRRGRQRHGGGRLRIEQIECRGHIARGRSSFDLRRTAACRASPCAASAAASLAPSSAGAGTPRAASALCRAPLRVTATQEKDRLQAWAECVKAGGKFAIIVPATGGKFALRCGAPPKVVATIQAAATAAVPAIIPATVTVPSPMPNRGKRPGDNPRQPAHDGRQCAGQRHDGRTQ